MPKPPRVSQLIMTRSNRNRCLPSRVVLVCNSRLAPSSFSRERAFRSLDNLCHAHMGEQSVISRSVFACRIVRTRSMQGRTRRGTSASPCNFRRGVLLVAPSASKHEHLCPVRTVQSRQVYECLRPNQGCRSRGVASQLKVKYILQERPLSHRAPIAQW